jgi:hypothetical protein
MGLMVTIEHQGVGVLFTFSGVLTGDEILAESQALYSQEGLKKLRYQLVDMRDVNRIELNTEQIQRLAEVDRAAAQQGHGFLIASVVSHDLQAGISKFYRAYVEDPNIESAIFRSMPQARQWLHLKLLERGLTLEETGLQSDDREVPNLPV